jgi:hypothetical protein
MTVHLRMRNQTGCAVRDTATRSSRTMASRRDMCTLSGFWHGPCRFLEQTRGAALVARPPQSKSLTAVSTPGENLRSTRGRACASRIENSRAESRIRQGCAAPDVWLRLCPSPKVDRADCQPAGVQWHASFHVYLRVGVGEAVPTNRHCWREPCGNASPSAADAKVVGYGLALLRSDSQSPIGVGAL